jgi:hypothetical protein
LPANRSVILGIRCWGTLDEASGMTPLIRVDRSLMYHQEWLPFQLVNEPNLDYKQSASPLPVAPVSTGLKGCIALLAADEIRPADRSTLPA